MKNTRVRNRPVIGMECQVDIAAAPAEDKPATFDMVAYTGGPMTVSFWGHPVLVDLAGLEVSAKSRPIFKDHNPGQIVGHTTEVTKQNGQLTAKGVISGPDNVTADIVTAAKKGFPWQASIGAKVKDVVFVDKGATVKANGQSHAGPLYLVRKSRLSEISFVALGADDNTSSRVAAQSNDHLEVVEMKFSEWLEALGLSADDLNEGQLAKLQAKFDAEQAAVGQEEEKPVRASNPTAHPASVPTVDIIAQAAEQARYVAEITAAVGGDAELLAQALAGKWSADTAKLAKENKDLKAQRPAPVNGSFAIHSHSRDISDDVLVAAVAMQMGVTPDELRDPLHGYDPERRRALRASSERALDEKVIDAADRQFRHIGLRDVCHIVASRDAGFNGMYGDWQGMIKASFTTLSLPTVFQQALNRALLAQYKMSAFNWRAISKATSVPDFRLQERFRIHGTGHWERLTDAGEIKQGQIEEGDKYSIKADTIGQMLMLTRQDFINDDLGALNRIAEMMTFYGNLAPEIEVFKAILANSGSFFHANNDNLITGAGTAFGLQGLTDLWTKFRKRRDKGVSKDKIKPGIDITPRILLVPVELELNATLLLGQSKLEVGGGNTATGLVTTDNPFFNKFRIVSSIYLSDTTVHANASATAYYLLAEPALLPSVEVAFLNGKQRPTIESVEPRPEVLGMGFRGWFDFGVKLMDPKAAAKAAGA